MPATILVSAVGRRRYVVEELLRFAAAGDTVLVADENFLAPALHVPGAVGVEPRAGRDPVSWIRALSSQHRIDAVLSLHDFDVVSLARSSAMLATSGVSFIGPSESAAVSMIDKIALQDFLLRYAPQLHTRTLSVQEATFGAKLPVVVKDRFGSGSSGVSFVSTKEELHQASESAATRKVWTPEGLRPGELVAQEPLAGIEYNLDLFFDANSRVVGHSLKQKLSMRDGETDAARIIAHGLDGVLSEIRTAFSRLGIIGNLDIDFFYDGSSASIIDVNPRFGGGYAFSAKFGYDAARGVWDVAKKLPIKDYLCPIREATAAKYVSVAELSGT